MFSKIWYGDEVPEEKVPFTDKFSANIEDCKENHRVLFRNIENKLVKDIRVGRVQFEPEDCLKLIKGFSAAQVGTNMFFELMMRKVAKKSLSLEESIVLLNYLPHALFDNDVVEEEIYVENGRTEEVEALYREIEAKLSESLNSMRDEPFMEAWQGYLRVSKPSFELIGQFLDEYEKRVNNWSFEQKINFIQLLAYFCKYNKEIFSKIELNEVVKVTNTGTNLNLKEISTILWCYHHMKVLSNTILDQYSPRLEEIALDYIKADKPEFDNLGYKSTSRYYDQFNIDPYDLEVILFFFPTPTKTTKILEEALKTAQEEDTHPIARKSNHTIFKL